MQAVSFSGDDHNPRPIMSVAVLFIILSFVIGIPLAIIYFTVYYNNDDDDDNNYN